MRFQLPGVPRKPFLSKEDRIRLQLLFMRDMHEIHYQDESLEDFILESELDSKEYPINEKELHLIQHLIKKMESIYEE